jgi:sterol desaturase/sphingolipid hydroxylase (fatty acid hydroxylase superfamily)
MKILFAVVASIVVAEFLGYWLHRLLHSGKVRMLSRSHMKHHLILYGPKQNQRPSTCYFDATVGKVALGNIGWEWIVPAAVLLGVSLLLFRLFAVHAQYQVIYIVVVLAWSFVTFSYLHDRMHIRDFWMEKSRWTRRWFLCARQLHDVHHRTFDNHGKMDKNFGIGFFFFDSLFGTLAPQQRAFNHRGYQEAKDRYGIL